MILSRQINTAMPLFPRSVFLHTHKCCKSHTVKIFAVNVTRFHHKQCDFWKRHDTSLTADCYCHYLTQQWSFGWKETALFASLIAVGSLKHPSALGASCSTNESLREHHGIQTQVSVPSTDLCVYVQHTATSAHCCSSHTGNEWSVLSMQTRKRTSFLFDLDFYAAVFHCNKSFRLCNFSRLFILKLMHFLF